MRRDRGLRFWKMAAGGSLAGGVLLAAALASPGRAASPCEPDASDGEAVTVSAALPDRRIGLADGRRLRLAGLEPASLRLPDLAGREATLIAPQMRDRHGNLRGDLVV